MVAFLTIVYTSLVLVLFKMKLVKPRPIPIACMVVVGVLLLGGVVVGWFLCAPMTGRVVTSQYVVQLVPYVKGQIVKIHAQANQPIKKGDLLLEINPEPYEYAVDQVQAQLQSARDSVKQAGAGLEATKANVDKSAAGITQAQAAVDQAKAAVVNARAAVDKTKALTDLALTEQNIAVGLQKVDAGAISELKVAKAVQNLQAQEAALKQALAGVNEALAGQGQADAGLVAARATLKQTEASQSQATFTLQIAQSNVLAVQAQLKEAEFNLAQCKMRAPADGFIVNWQVQEGTMLVSMPMAPAGTFINTAFTFIAASFPQNHLTNVEAGDEVEVVLAPFPGKLFTGKVDAVIQASGDGQYEPSGQLPLASKVGSQGLLAVKISLTGETPPVALGVGGTVAIYTKVGKPVHVISKVAIRMKKYLLYVIPD